MVVSHGEGRIKGRTIQSIRRMGRFELPVEPGNQDCYRDQRYGK
ncbi:MAG: hypothetical protein R3B95_15225 [Nitrospirales bacterium]